MTLATEVVHEDAGYRYRIKDGAKTLLTSGLFQTQADAKRCGENVAGDPVSLRDFLKR